MKRMERNTARGFTLIELLVVVGILAILLGVLVPTLHAVFQDVKVAQTQKLIGGLSAALDSYKQMYNTYPPDRHPRLDKSSECLVYYLSGASVVYVPGMSPDTYPWQNSLYRDEAGGGARGRRTATVFYPFSDASRLADRDPVGSVYDQAPELFDPWGKRVLYNCGNDINYDAAPPAPVNPSNQFGAPRHRVGAFDLFSAGPDRLYGTPDDVTNWGTAPVPGPDYDYSTFNPPNDP